MKQAEPPVFLFFVFWRLLAGLLAGGGHEQMWGSPDALGVLECAPQSIPLG